MHLNIDNAATAQALLDDAAAVAAMTHRPTFAVLKANWCGHCQAMQPSLDALQKTLMPVDALNVLVIEVDALNGLRHPPSNPVVKTVMDNALHKQGVPFITLMIPERIPERMPGSQTQSTHQHSSHKSRTSKTKEATQQVAPRLTHVPYNQERSQKAMARFILDTIKAL